ncbi:MAG: cytochrome c3 family protein [Candidatus Sulfopaludibacter sp.]|nr:cytochrome c3 family protein [Candidatus Sulfopaludibacter sp.]
MRRILVAMLMAGALGAGDGSKTSPAPNAAGVKTAEERLEVPPPPFSEGIFPCSNCHEGMPVNRTRRELTLMHTDIVLKHDETHRWCLDCHDATNRNTLHLASGEPVPFEESYRLCGQCHGEKLRDWRAGVHGRRTGNWNGAKQYLLCANCHNPHQPRFRALAPKPAPKPPHRPGLD